MRRRLSITVLISVVLLTVATVKVEAQAARVSVTIKDAAGKPIEGATLTATCSEKESYSVVRTSNKKGKITLTHMESLLTYRYEISKEGYQAQVTQVRPDYTETTRTEIVLLELDLQDPAEINQTGQGRAFEAFTEGTEAHERGDLELAEKRFRQAAELSPDAAEPHIALAVVAHQRGDYASAATEAEAALERSPNNEQAMQLRYDAYRMLGDEQKAQEAAAALRESGGASGAAGTVYSEGIAAYKAGDLELATAKFEQALELDPTLANAALMLGSMALGDGNLDRATEMVARVLEIDPGNPHALMINYDATRAGGDPAATRAALDALIEADPTWASTDLFNHAVELYNADEMASAADALKRVVELRPDDARANYLLGMALYNTGDVAGAKAHLTRFLELAPEDPDAAVAREMLKYAQ